MKRRTLIKTIPLLAASNLLLAQRGARAQTAATKARSASFEDIPVILECGINGTTKKSRNPLAPETVEEHIVEMGKCIDAGATIVHNHSNIGSEDPAEAARFYLDVYRPLRAKYPDMICYATVNFDAKEFNRIRTSWPDALQCQHQRILAESGLANMVLFETGVSSAALFDKDGVTKADTFFVYQFWPEDIRYTRQICSDLGVGASFSVYEPGWLKNIIAMAKAGTLPRGSKLNLYFGGDEFPAMAPPIPEALELYIKMMEGLDLKWGVACPARDGSIMDTPIARMALERGGSLRVGLEDDTTGPSNVEQIERAYEMTNVVGRRIVTGTEAIKYLDIQQPTARQ